MVTNLQGGVPPPGAPGAVEQLSKLADLRDCGVLGEAEFEEQKKRILGCWTPGGYSSPNSSCALSGNSSFSDLQEAGRHGEAGG